MILSAKSIPIWQQSSMATGAVTVKLSAQSGNVYALGDPNDRLGKAERKSTVSYK